MNESGPAFHRHEKLASEIQQAVQKVFTKGLSDPRLERSMLTVTGVEVTQDNKIAFIAVSVLPEKHETRVKAGLKHCARFIRREAGELVRTNVLPAFEFHIDNSLKKQAKVMEALAKVNQEQAAAAEAKPPATDPAAGQP
jgi:ribosome-binding factor A